MTLSSRPSSRLAILGLVVACGPMPAAEPSTPAGAEGFALAPQSSVAPADTVRDEAASPQTPHPPQAPELGAPARPSPSTSPTLAETPAAEEAVEFEEQGDLPAAQRQVLRIIAKCHLRALDRGDDSAGPLFVQLSLDPAGRVLDVTMAEGFSHYVETCAEPRLRELVFAPGDGRLGMLRIPLTELSAEEVDPAPTRD